MNSEAVAVGKARPSSRCCPHWTYFLLFGVILAVSVAVSLVLLPHFLSEYDPLTVSDSVTSIHLEGPLIYQENALAFSQIFQKYYRESEKFDGDFARCR